MNAPLDIRICPGVFIFPFFTQDSGSGHIQKECFSAEQPKSLQRPESLQQPESSQQANTKDMGPKKAREKKGDLYENYFTGRKCTGSRG